MKILLIALMLTLCSCSISVTTLDIVVVEVGKADVLASMVNDNTAVDHGKK